MESMIIFTTQLLDVIANFLTSEPMIYVFSVLVFGFIIKIFRGFLP